MTIWMNACNLINRIVSLLDLSHIDFIDRFTTVSTKHHAGHNISTNDGRFMLEGIGQYGNNL